MDFMVETWMLDGHLWVEVAGVGQKGPGCEIRVAMPHVTWAIPGRPQPVGFHGLMG